MNAHQDMRLGFEDRGTGEPMVFIHGTAGDRTHWHRVLGEMGKQGPGTTIRAILPELYGYGRSRPWPHDRDIGIEDHVDAVMAILDREILDRLDAPFFLVGHSLGGAVALQIALRHPDRVRGLVLAEPAPFHLLRTGEDRDADLLEDLAAVGRQLAAGGRQQDPEVRLSTTGLFVDYWNGAGVWDSIPDVAKQDMSRRLSSIGSDFTTLYAAKNPISDYKAIRVPATVIRGGRSPRPTQRIAEIVAATLPQAKLFEIPDAGHMIPLSHPGALARWILSAGQQRAA